MTSQEDTLNMKPKLNREPKLILNAASRSAALGLVLATAVISSCSTGVRHPRHRGGSSRPVGRLYRPLGRNLDE